MLVPLSDGEEEKDAVNVELDVVDRVKLGELVDDTLIEKVPE